MSSDLLKLLPQFDVISFDVFDTLLLRPYLKPTDLFRKVAGETFMRERIAAERAARDEARAAGREEVTYDEIYAKLPRWCDIKQRELDEERRCLTANPEIVEVYKAAQEAGKKVVIASDMYLPRAFLEEVLRGQGIDGWDAFYLSSDCMKSKFSGSLFAELRAAYAPPLRILHIGDNKLSDGERPQKHGIQTRLYEKLSESFVRTFPFAIDFLAGENRIARNSLVGCLALAWHLYKCRDNVGYWEALGLIFAGAFGWSFVEWTVRMARKNKINHLMFVARDGYVWKKICEALYPGLKTDYFFAPRIASILVCGNSSDNPCGTQCRREGLLSYLTTVTGQTLDETEKQQYLDTGRLPRRFEEFVNVESKRAKDQFSEYLQSFDIRADDLMIVDGCSAGYSVQRLVSRVLNRPVYTAYLMATSPFRNDAAAFYYAPLKTIPAHAFLEFFFGGPTPPAKWVGADGPIFGDVRNPFELFKMGIAEDVAQAAVFSSRLLSEHCCECSPTLLLEFVECFMRCQTELDRKNLVRAGNSFSVDHSDSRPVTWNPFSRRRVLLSLLGRPIFAVYRFWRKGAFVRELRFCGRIVIRRKETPLFEECYEK